MFRVKHAIVAILFRSLTAWWHHTLSLQGLVQHNKQLRM